MNQGVQTKFICFLIMILLPAFAWSASFSGELAGSKRFRKGKGNPAANHGTRKPKKLRLKRSSYDGLGCPNGSLAIVLSPEGTTLSILMDEFVVEVGGEEQIRKKKKVCHIQVPMEFEGHHQFSVVKMDYRGYQFLPRGGHSTILSEYSFGRQGRGKSKKIKRHMKFKGPMDEDFILSSELVTKDLWSKCDTSPSFKIKISLTAKTNQELEEAASVIDSLDIDGSETQYHLKWRKCQKGKKVKRSKRRAEIGFRMAP